MTPLNATGAPAAIGPYCHAVNVGGLLFTSGQIPLDLAGGMPEGIEAQTEQVFDNLAAVLAEAGTASTRWSRPRSSSPTSAISPSSTRSTRAFGEHKPARSTVQVAGLPRGAWSRSSSSPSLPRPIRAARAAARSPHEKDGGDPCDHGPVRRSPPNRSRRPQDFHRGLKDRHVQLIALGGAIGVGLFLGSGRAINQAGPGLIFAYAAAGVIIFFIMRALGELMLHRPVAGSFATYAEEYVSPFAGFATGWSYWFMWVVTGMAEITAVGIYTHYWFPDVPQWIPALVDARRPLRRQPRRGEALRRVGVLVRAHQDRRDPRPAGRRTALPDLRLGRACRGRRASPTSGPTAASSRPACSAWSSRCRW